MFALERSARDHMKSPSIAQRAREGLGVGVGSRTYCQQRTGSAAWCGQRHALAETPCGRV